MPLAISGQHPGGHLVGDAVGILDQGRDGDWAKIPPYGRGAGVRGRPEGSEDLQPVRQAGERQPGRPARDDAPPQ